MSLDTDNVARFGRAVGAHLAGGGLAIIATHIDLGLKTATTLDISTFKAPLEDHGNQFLEGDFT